jgi:hypothetical protein
MSTAVLSSTIIEEGSVHMRRRHAEGVPQLGTEANPRM